MELSENVGPPRLPPIFLHASCIVKESTVSPVEGHIDGDDDQPRKGYHSSTLHQQSLATTLELLQQPLKGWQSSTICKVDGPMSSSGTSSISLGDDPKRPSAVRRFSRMRMDADSLPPDYYGLVSLLLGVCAVMLKMKIFSWLALCAAMGSVANAKTTDADYKQIVTSMMLSVMSLFLNYFGPAAQQQAFQVTQIP